MDNLVTIIVPVYKVEPYLDQCVESLVNQTYSNLEIILVDDGSPDNCPKMCDAWANRDSRINVIHRVNGGLSAARNDGIKAAHGEYLMYVDSDDYLEKEACENLVNYAGDADIIVGEATISENGVKIPRIHTNLIENYYYSGEEYSIAAIKKGEWFAASCYNFYKTEFIRDNELFFFEGVLHEDIEYTPRLFLAAKKVKYLHYQFYNYIIRGDSITGNIGKKHFDDLLLIYSKWYKLNKTIENVETKKAYSGALAKYFISTCRTHKITERIYPEGMNAKYLIDNALDMKELMKASAFIISRKLYVRL